MSSVAENLTRINERIATACAKAGRREETVRLMAVSKRQSDTRVSEALALGLRLFGESRVQETRDKTSLFPDDAEIHLVGHLQRNKAREAASLYHAVDSIDAERTVAALDARLAEVDRSMSVLVEVNTSGEEQKHGVRTYEELVDVAAAIVDAPRLELRGLMTIGPISRDERILRRAFAMLRDYRDRLATQLPAKDLPELSMGMSNDLEEAILEGATTVRVGTALFGERTT